MVYEVKYSYNVSKLNMDVLSMNYKENTRKILANNIKYFRLKKNLSQEEFAELLGTTPVYLSTLENAKRNIRTDYIGHIADTLEVNVKELFVERTKVINTRRPKKSKKITH